jgi:tetratricopeptide (TPR) repeat protein
MTTKTWYEQGQASVDVGRYVEAFGFFRKAMEEEPDNGLYVAEAGLMLLYTGDRVQAEEYANKAIAMSPDHPIVNIDYATVIAHLNRADEAIARFEKVITQLPEEDFPLFRYGQTLQLLGKLDKAEEVFRRACFLNPERAHNFYQLGRLTKLKADDPCFKLLETMMERIDEFSPGRQTNFHFAYAHALAAQGRHEDAFEHYVKANANHRQSVQFDEDRMVRHIVSNAKMVDKAGTERWEGRGHQSAAPIFIISMPRSGSTLVEQILTSHSRVGGLSERGVMEQAKEVTGGFSLYCHDEAFTQGKLVELGAAYLDIVYKTQPEMQSMRHFTDKSLSLFQYVGWAHLAFPNAKFIYVTRDVIDMALSIFSLRFAGIEYAYDLGEIGRRYRTFHELMEYWKGILPAGTMLELKYEDLVNDLEGQTRQLLQFCGLTFENDCLNFHENDRIVNTMSNTQVRRPLYRTSLKHWRPSEEQLKPLYEGLGEELTAMVKAQEARKE